MKRRAKAGQADEQTIPVVKLESIELNEQGQLVSKTSYLHQIAETAGTRLRSGRPRAYDHDAITRVAEACIAMGVDDYLDRFVERVRNECKPHHIKTPKDTVLTEICAAIYKREHTKVAKK
jgi:hypothetical protein